MKAIGIKMVELQPMIAKEAFDKGYGMKSTQDPDGDGYEVTYPDGYKSWSPKLEVELMQAISNIS